MGPRLHRRIPKVLVAVGHYGAAGGPAGHLRQLGLRALCTATTTVRPQTARNGTTLNASA